MPISLYDPSTQHKRPLAPGQQPTLLCAATEGGPARLDEVRSAVVHDVLRRQLPFREYAPDTTLDALLRDMAQDELAGACEPEVLRYLSLTVSYREPLPLDERSGEAVRYPQLDDCERRLAYLYAAKKRFLELPKERILAVQTAPPEVMAGFCDALGSALEDDLATPLALAEVQEFAIAVNALVDAALRKQGRVNESAVESAQAGFSTIKGLLGLGADDPSAFLRRVRDRRAGQRGIDLALVDRKVQQREKARADKDFATADSLQTELLALGVTLLDGPQGTAWTLT